MKKTHALFSILLIAGLLLLLRPAIAPAAGEESGGQDDKPNINISENMGDAMSRQATQVKQEIEKQARSLFRRTPLGFDLGTIDYLYRWALSLPGKIPLFMQTVVEQSKLLGFVGSLLILTFIVALVYSFLGQRRVMARIEARLSPLAARIPPSVVPFILAVIRVVIAALIPVSLLAVFGLINALIEYQAPWFTLIGRLLKVWTVAALAISLLRELLTRGLFQVTAEHGRQLFRLTRLVVLYCAFGVGLYFAAHAFQLRQDVLALIRFAVSLSIVLVLFLLLLKKRALLSLLPKLPQRSYQKFARMLERYYFPLIFFSLILALLWSLGYRTLGRVLLVKIWASGGAYLAILVVYHLLLNALNRWYARVDKDDEAAALVFRSIKSLLIYGMVLGSVLIVLNLLGLLGLIEQAMSFPVIQLGDTHVSFWILIKAVLILVAFYFISRLLQAYLDYRVYPAVGIEPGLGYALNTFLKYLLLAIGCLVALDIVGLDLRFLLVFAGAVGIGIGIGLQSIAANIISGFLLIFGGKLRKGDWVEVGGTMGVVTDILLRATQVRTRDNIEYIIPNSQFVDSTLINYSLDSPLIRVSVPVGVSYNADPRQVEKILLETARREPTVSKEKPSLVRFVQFGDNSINFELLVWINVRITPRAQVRSALYFTIFDELKKAGIEIPFPQRDIHIRSGLPQQSLEPLSK